MYSLVLISGDCSYQMMCAIRRGFSRTGIFTIQATLDKPCFKTRAGWILSEATDDENNNADAKIMSITVGIS